MSRDAELSDLAAHVEQLRAELSALRSQSIPRVERASKRRDRRQVVAGMAAFVVAVSLGGLGGAQALGGSNTVFTDDIVDGNVRTVDIAAGAVTSAKLADGSLRGIDILNGSVASVDVTDNSLTGVDILNGSVGAADVTDNSLTGADINESTLVLPAPLPAKVSTAPDAITQLQGTTTSVTAATVILPAGTWFVTGKVIANVTGDANGADSVACHLMNGPTSLDFSSLYGQVMLAVGPGGSQIDTQTYQGTLPTMATVAVPTSTTLTLECSHSAGDRVATIRDAKLQAIQVKP